MVRSDKDYILNIYDPNEIVNWKDVIQVIFHTTSYVLNSEDIKCPICMENLQKMVVPKITKCGHTFCWPCILQYLAFEKHRSWKRCPLCNESVYKHELKGVRVVKDAYTKIGDTLKFDLHIRSKTNIIVKNKFLSEIDDKTIPSMQFPFQDQLAFSSGRILLSKDELEEATILQEKDLLLKEQSFV